MSFDTLEKSVILVVDDTPINLEVLLDLLEDSDFKVVVAEDGESAMEMAEYAPPSLILLDVLMPGIDGFETCRRLKSNKVTQDIPVIFMTALTEKVDKVKGLNLGAVDYITKPLEHEEVLARVNIHLRLRHLTKRLTEQNERLQEEISERKRAQEEREEAFTALRQSEARFRRLVESNIIGIICTNLNGTITDANDAFLQMVGYDRSQLLKGDLRWDEMTPLEYRGLDEKAIAELSTSRVCTPYEKEFMRSDGTRIPIMIGAVLLEESQHSAVGFVLDLSDRKIAEQKIREQAALLDITTDAILVQDLNKQIRFWNEGAERLYGWKAQEVIGKDVHEVLYRRKTLDQLEESWKSLTECGSWQSELYQFTKEGKEIIVASRWTLVRDEHGQPKSILTVNTDITEKKQLEAQFLRTQRMDSLGTLASGIAHDLNNALTPIMMAAQLLECKVPDEQSQQWLSILETNVKRAADLVKQVLLFSRGVAGKHTPLEVGYLIKEIEKIVKQTFSRAIEIRSELPTQNLWTISGDLTQLHQVLMNLCVNARDAMPDGGTLQISARNFWVDAHYAQMNIEAKVGPYIVITVSDTGTGISKEIIDRVFEPFFTTKELGKGTQFQVYLPATPTTKSDSPSEGHDELPRGHGELILVVDDEDSIRDITKTLLETYGYQVVLASDGIEALALYTQHQDKISVVLMDMMMPNIDGPTTVGVLQKINPQVKIIAISGLVSNHKIGQFLGNSVKTFLPKPYTSDELLRNLQLVLSID